MTGWTLPRKPDLVLNVQAEPYVVPAKGPVRYQYFTLDPGFTEGKWITASQIIPGSARAVHHVLCFVRPPNHDGGSDEENGLGYLSAYVPGYRVSPFPQGMAKYVPAGSKLVFQMHYTPIGNEHTDLSRIGFIFAKPEELTHLVTTVSMDNHSINIPPHAEDYKREATMSAYKHDLKVLSFSPHMHLRGAAFSYEAIYPDGKREMLLNVPRFDFNWQTCYELAEPKTLPPGTRVHCVAHWDNSENNLANPNPAATVNWGDQTFEEMMIGFFDVAIPIDREKLLATGTIPKLEPAATLEDRAKSSSASSITTVTASWRRPNCRSSFKRCLSCSTVTAMVFLTRPKCWCSSKPALEGARAPVATSAGSRPHRPKRRRPISPRLAVYPG